MRSADYYDRILPNAELLADELAEVLWELDRPDKTVLLGLRGIRRAGIGIGPMGFKEHDPGSEPRSQIDARFSAAKGSDFVREMEDEMPHHIYLWRATGPAMDFTSAGTDMTAMPDEEKKHTPFLEKHFVKKLLPRPAVAFMQSIRKKRGLTGAFSAAIGKSPLSEARTSKQEAADTMLLAVAKLLLQETQTNQIALLNNQARSYSGRQDYTRLSEALMNAQEPVRCGAMNLTGSLRPRAYAVLFADCIAGNIDEQALERDLKQEPDSLKHENIFVRHYIQPILNDIATLHAQDIRGHFVDIADPMEDMFPFFQGQGGDGRIVFHFEGREVMIPRASAMRDAYISLRSNLQRSLHDELTKMDWTYSTYVTDQPLATGLASVLGLPGEETSLQEPRPEPPKPQP
jgi:hypothetical protein